MEEVPTVNHMYVLLRLDTSPNLLNTDSNIDCYEAKAFLSHVGAHAVMKAEYDESVHESDWDSYFIDGEARIITGDGLVKRWKIQVAEVLP